MVSFQCEQCGDVIKKPKLDSHNQTTCRGTAYTCLDCNKTFTRPIDWKSHVSCISEEQKYHKTVYQEKKRPGQAGKPARPKDFGEQPVKEITEEDMPRGGGGYRGGGARGGGRGRSGPGNRGAPAGRGRGGFVKSATGANMQPLASPRNMTPRDSPEIAESVSPSKAAMLDAAKQAPRLSTDAIHPDRKRKSDALMNVATDSKKVKTSTRPKALTNGIATHESQTLEQGPPLATTTTSKSGKKTSRSAPTSTLLKTCILEILEKKKGSQTIAKIGQKLDKRLKKNGWSGTEDAATLLGSVSVVKSATGQLVLEL